MHGGVGGAVPTGLRVRHGRQPERDIHLHRPNSRGGNVAAVPVEVGVGPVGGGHQPVGEPDDRGLATQRP